MARLREEEPALRDEARILDHTRREEQRPRERMQRLRKQCQRHQERATVSTHAASPWLGTRSGASHAADAVAIVKPEAQPGRTKFTTVSGVAHS